ncbi:hypothetical protein NMT12_210001 [metagenome]
MLDGAVQDRLTCVGEELTAVRLVGESGATGVAGVETGVAGVADASFDAELVPTEFIAETL